MKRSLLAPCLALAVCSLTYAQQVQWLVNTEEAGNPHTIRDLWEVANDDIIIQQRSDTGDLVAKFSPTGQALWANAYSTLPYPNSSPEAFEAFADGSSAMLLRHGADPQPGDGYYLILVRLNSDGSVAWSRKLLFESSSAFGEFKLVPFSSGKLLVLGFGGSISHLFRMTMTVDGQLEDASMQAQGSWIDFAHLAVSVSEQDEVTILISPATAGQMDMVTRWNSAGQEQWSKRVRLTNFNWPASSNLPSHAVDTDGNTYVFGQLRSFGAPSLDFPYLFKLGNDGDLDWYKLYGDGSTELYTTGAGRQLPDGTLHFAAFRTNVFDTSGTHLDQFYVSLTDPAGTPDSIEWNAGSRKAVGDTMLLAGRRYREDPFFGYTWSWPFIYKEVITDGASCLWEHVQHDLFPSDTMPPANYLEVLDLPPFEPLAVTVSDTLVYVIPKPLPTTQPLCAVAVGVAERSAPSMRMWPDPVMRGGSVELQVPLNARYEVRDVQGRIHQAPRTSSSGRATITTADLSAGVYFVNVLDDRGTRTGTLRLVVQ